MKYIDNDGNLWNGYYIVVGNQTIINPTEEILLLNGYTKIEDPEKIREIREKHRAAMRGQSSCKDEIIDLFDFNL